MKATISYTLLFILTFFSVTPALRAQQQQSGATPPPMVIQPASSGAPGLDGQGVRRYILGPGDTLDVRVFGQPEMNWQGEVDSDGYLSSLPFIDKPILAQCRTDKDIEKDIRAAYSKYLKKPDVSVRVTGRNSRTPAYVYGAFKVPQRVGMARRVRLNEIFAVSGGVSDASNGKIMITHTEPLMCPQPGDVIDPDEMDGREWKLTYKTYKIADLKAGMEEANPYIRPGDVVQALEAEPVYINGSVVSPQPIYLRDGLTLSVAIAMVGGVSKSANPSNIVVYRINKNSKYRDRVVYDLKAVKKRTTEDPLLQAYDIVEVPDQGVNIPKMILNSALGIIPATVTSVGTTLPYRVIY